MSKNIRVMLVSFYVSCLMTFTSCPTGPAGVSGDISLPCFETVRYKIWTFLWDMVGLRGHDVKARDMTACYDSFFKKLFTYIFKFRRSVIMFVLVNNVWLDLIGSNCIVCFCIMFQNDWVVLFSPVDPYPMLCRCLEKACLRDVYASTDMLSRYGT